MPPVNSNGRRPSAIDGEAARYRPVLDEGQAGTDDDGFPRPLRSRTANRFLRIRLAHLSRRSLRSAPH